MKPTIVYKLGGPHWGPKNNKYSYQGVSDEGKLKELLSSGWFESLDEAIAGKPAKKEAPKAPEPKPIEELKDTDVSFKEPKVEVRQYKDLTEEDKAEIKKRLDDGEKPSVIGKDYGMHHLNIARIGRELD